MVIPDFAKNPDWMCFIVGFAFLVLGLFTPKKFAAIEMEWRPATSLVAILLGAALMALSYPQLRFWQSNTVNVDRAILDKIAANAKQGHDSIMSARSSGGDYPWCYNHASAGLAPLSEALNLLKPIAKAP